MTTGTLTKWYVEVGSHVAVGDLLYDVRVDKLTEDGGAVEMEVEAHEDVFVKELVVAEGQQARPNETIALVVEEADDLSADRVEVSEAQFMWQGYTKRQADASGMCGRGARE